MTFLFDYWLSILLLAFALGALQQTGITIDFDTNRYKSTFGFLSLKFGRWKELPDIEYVSLFKTSEKTRVWVSAASTLTKNTVYIVNLFYDRNKRLEGYRSYDKNEGLRTALLFADALQTDLLDATINPSEWLDKAILRDSGKIVHKTS